MKNTLPNHSPWLYGLLWLFYLYMYIQLLGFNQGTNQNIIIAGMYFVSFGIHEAGHIVFSYAPAIITAAMGSLSEIIFACLLVFAAYRVKSYFAGIFALLWLMMATASAGNYMADARAQAMTLIGLGSDPKHDWHFVFGQLGWLDADIAIGTTIKVIGAIIGASGLLFGLLLIMAMFMNRYQSSASKSIVNKTQR